MYSRLFLVVVSVAVVYAKSTFVNIPPDELPSFLQWSMECISKTNVQPDILEKIVSWTLNESQPVKNYMYCFATTSGYGDEKGHLVKDKMMKLVGNNKRKAEYGNVIDECNKLQGVDKYDTIYKTTVCFHDKSPILFKL